MGKKIKLLDFEKRRPLKLTKDGKYVTIENYFLNKNLDQVKIEIPKLQRELRELDYQDKKKLVLERYKAIPEEDKKIEHILGVGSFTRLQNLNEIEQDSDFGKELIEIELLYLFRILNKYKDGEIE